MAAPYGSPRLIGLGFLVWISIIVSSHSCCPGRPGSRADHLRSPMQLIDLLGPPLLKNASVMLGLLVGIIVAAACGYFDTS